jgi:hypothetical protein
MFFFQFEATPRTDHPEGDEVAGAYVNCWIDRPTIEEAEHVARTMISEDCWIVGEPDEAHAVDRDYYANNPDGLQYFEQALIDKEVLVFHTFPIDELPENGDRG